MRKGIVRTFDADVSRLGCVEIPGFSCEGVIIIDCNTIAHSVESDVIRPIPSGGVTRWPTPGEEVLVGTLRPDGKNLRATYWLFPAPVSGVSLGTDRVVYRRVAARNELKRGTIKYFNPDKRYGFVIPDGGGEDVFIHASGMADRMEDGSLRRSDNRANITLCQGQGVLYVPVIHEGRVRAGLWCLTT